MMGRSAKAHLVEHRFASSCKQSVMRRLQGHLALAPSRWIGKESAKKSSRERKVKRGESSLWRAPRYETVIFRDWKVYNKPGLHIIIPIEYIAIGKKRLSSCTTSRAKSLGTELGRIGYFRVVPAQDQKY